MATLKIKYREEIAPKLKEELGLFNAMEVPRVTKITLNMGVGEAVGDKKVLENAVSDMQKIAGQKPVVTKSRKSIAGFKIRDGWPIGCKVTLRDEQMYEFLVQKSLLQTSNYLEQLHQKTSPLQSNHLVQYLYLEQHLTESSIFTLAKVLYSVSVKVQKQSQSKFLHSRQIWNSRVLLLRDAHLAATLDSEIYLFLEQLHQNYLHLQSNQKYKSKYLELQKLQELVLTLSKVLSSQLDLPTKQLPENYLHSR